MIFNIIVIVFWSLVLVFILISFFKSIRIVSNMNAEIVETFGKYSRTLGAGFHFLFPFVDKVAYKISLKEETINIEPQECFTQDNVRVLVDGLLYLEVKNPKQASYGITNYKLACEYLAKTTTRSIIATLDLDKTFEERAVISQGVVNAVNSAGLSWGIRVLRYEIQNISTPKSVRESMEKQVEAEREYRATMSFAEGERISKTNQSQGIKEEMIKNSEGEAQSIINQAEAEALKILASSKAFAYSIQKMSNALQDGGEEAFLLKSKEEFIKEFSKNRGNNTDIILSMDLKNIDELLKSIKL